MRILLISEEFQWALVLISTSRNRFKLSKVEQKQNDNYYEILKCQNHVLKIYSFSYLSKDPTFQLKSQKQALLFLYSFNCSALRYFHVIFTQCKSRCMKYVNMEVVCWCWFYLSFGLIFSIFHLVEVIIVIVVVVVVGSIGNISPSSNIIEPFQDTCSISQVQSFFIFFFTRASSLSI